MDMPDAVGTIDHTQYPFVPTDSSKSFEGEANTRVANDGIENRCANRETLCPRLLDNVAESLLKFTLSNRIFKGHFPSLKRRMFLQRDEAFFHGTVDWLEIDNSLTCLEIEVI